jgi:hypothetical protein
VKSTHLFLAAICVAGSGNALAQAFWDNDITNGHVRTEYVPALGTPGYPMTLRYDEESAEGCKFDSADSFSGCPGRAGLPQNARAREVWLGALQWNEACGGSYDPDADSWKGCLAYRQSNYYEANPTHSNYWMLTANYDPSFDQCNSGMPGTSHPVVDIASEEGGIFQFQVEKYRAESGDFQHRFHFAINSRDHDFFCASQGDYQSSLPFLSVGAQNGAGTDGPIGVIDSENESRRQDRLQFDYEVVDYLPYSCLPETRDTCYAQYAGSHSGFFLLATWDGINRMLFVELWRSGHFAEPGYGPASGKWNWPIRESVYYPGAEIATLPIGHPDVALCGLGLEPFTEADVGAAKSYRVGASELYVCADALGLFSSEMPAGSIDLDGVHWFAESYGTDGYLWAALDRVRINGDETDHSVAARSDSRQRPVSAPRSSAEKIKRPLTPKKP